jgi:hypothetical protein
MAVHDQACAADPCEVVDFGEAVRMAGGCFVSHQDVAGLGGEAVEILRKDGVAVEQGQAASPGFVWAEGGLEAGAGLVGGAPLVRMPNSGLENAGEAGDAQAVDGGDLQAEVAGVAGQIVVGGFGLGVVIAEDPAHVPALPDGGGQGFR